MENTIFIPGNVPSSKNSKRIVYRGSKPILIWSQLATDYRDFIRYPMLKHKNIFKSFLKGKTPPYDIEFTFVRNSKRKFDYVGPLETIQDIMVQTGWIEDDNADVIKPHFGDYLYSKKSPGVFIKVL